jgi:hypothetical protein
MSLTLCHFEVEKGKKGWSFGTSLQKSFFALNFRQLAALRLHSCRALSSAYCKISLTHQMKSKKQSKKVLPSNQNVLPMS